MEASADIKQLRADLAAVTAERDELRSNLDAFTALEVQELHMTGGRMDMTSRLKRPVILGILAHALLDMLDADGAPNYCTYELGFPPVERDGQPRMVHVTVQRMEGETPAAQNTRLRAGLEAAQQRIAELERAVQSHLRNEAIIEEHEAAMEAVVKAARHVHDELRDRGWIGEGLDALSAALAALDTPDDYRDVPGREEYCHCEACRNGVDHDEHQQPVEQSEVQDAK